MSDPLLKIAWNNGNGEYAIKYSVPEIEITFLTYDSGRSFYWEHYHYTFDTVYSVNGPVHDLTTPQIDLIPLEEYVHTYSYPRSALGKDYYLIQELRDLIKLDGIAND